MKRTNPVLACLIFGLSAFGAWPVASADVLPYTLPVLEVVACNDSMIQDCGKGGDGGDEFDPTGTLLRCSDHEGNPDVFWPVESRAGENFAVWILHGVRSKDVLVGWNSQIPRAYEGVNTYLSYRIPPGPGHDQPGGPVTENRAFKLAITGACGVYAGTPQGATYDVQVDFMGQDVSITHTSGNKWEFSVSVKVETKFSIKPTSLNAVSVGAAVTGSFEFWNETTTTLQGYLKAFGQAGYPN